MTLLSSSGFNELLLAFTFGLSRRINVCGLLPSKPGFVLSEISEYK